MPSTVWTSMHCLILFRRTLLHYIALKEVKLPCWLLAIFLKGLKKALFFQLTVTTIVRLCQSFARSHDLCHVDALLYFYGVYWCWTNQGNILTNYWCSILYQSAVKKQKTKVTHQIRWIIVKITAECIFRYCFRCRGWNKNAIPWARARPPFAKLPQPMVPKQASFSNRGSSVSRLGAILMTWTASSSPSSITSPSFPLPLLFNWTRQERLFLSQITRQLQRHISCLIFWRQLTATEKCCLSFAGSRKEK